MILYSPQTTSVAMVTIGGEEYGIALRYMIPQLEMIRWGLSHLGGAPTIYFQLKADGAS
jgi:hypothetical protein